jgi:ubiquinone/menaquinone biosynthesis C-methylase UbiE
LASGTGDYAQLTYDKVADDYDQMWSRHVAGPNARLTLELDLKRGERVADLACGTGLYTVEMARLVAPGPVVGVDYSEGMLAAARQRAEEEGLLLELVHARAEDYIARCAVHSLDVVSLRFALAYVDWAEELPRIGQTLRPGGRVGVLTSLSGSIPQFAELYHRFRKSPEPAWKLFQHTHRSLGATWKIYRHLRETFGEFNFVVMPDSVAQVSERLSLGGLRTSSAWTDTIRLWFATGDEAVDWMIRSGYATNNLLENVGTVGRRFLESLFAAGMETFRERRGIPLDLVVAGVVAAAPSAS